MKSNKIPFVFDPLSTLTEKGLKGLHDLGATFPVTHNTEELVNADWGAARKAHSDYQFAKGLRAEAVKTQKTADKAAIAFITLVRENLKPTLGTKYSIAWNKVGFVTASLAVPRTMERRVSMVKTIEQFFDAQPDLEIAGVVSKTIATEIHDTLVTAISAVGKAQSEQREKRTVRDAAVAVLRLRMQNLFRELKQFLGPYDQRWLEFGFNVPGDETVPEAPDGLTVAPGAVGHATLSWERPAGAKRFRVFRQIVGVNAEFVHVQTVTDTSLDVGSMASGAQARFYVTAANDAGESLPSATVEVVVP